MVVLGTGARANRHAIEFGKIDGVEIVAAVDPDKDRVKAYADKYNINQTFASVDEAIAWGEFDAVANVTLDNAHYSTTMPLIAAGKHVFCEKPIAETYQEAELMASAAERAGLVAMVCLNFRDLPHLQKARELVAAGEIGHLKHFDASYLQSWLVSNAYGHWADTPKFLWRLSTKHGSNGVLGDLAVHLLDCSTFTSGSSVERIFTRLKCFEKVAGNRIGEYELDANDSFVMTVELENGALGTIQASRWATGYLNEWKVRLFGDKGGLELIYTDARTSLRVCSGEDVDNGAWREIDVDVLPTTWERFVRAAESGQAAEPSFRHSANLQRLVDSAFHTEQDRFEVKIPVDGDGSTDAGFVKKLTA